MRRLSLALVLAGLLLGLTATTASADPGSNNPNVQYRTFYCNDENSYNGAFVGPSASFLLTDSTSMFVMKVFTEYFPTGGSKTFNYGIKGFDPSLLLTCWYTDPQGVYNVFEGFFTAYSQAHKLSITDVGLVPCYPNLAGTLTGTDTGAGQFVITSNGVHVEGVETQAYRIDFANGWHLLSSSPTHFDTNFNFSNGQTENTLAQQDHGTLYDADGNAIGALDVWGVTHLAWRDLNGNGQPDPGELTANVNLGKFSCP